MASTSGPSRHPYTFGLEEEYFLVRRNGRLGLLIHVQSFQKIGQVGNAAAGLHWQGSAFHSGLLESEAVSRAVCRSRWGS